VTCGIVIVDLKREMNRLQQQKRMADKTSHTIS